MDFDLLPLARIVFQVLAYLVAAVYLLSGLDDLFYDLYFWTYALRRTWIARRFPRLTLERLEAREQQKVAIIIPAWQEAGVIGRMLRNACETIIYRNYDIFVGTYPNDPGTQHQVDLVALEYSRVHRIDNPAPGPTTKADNLNGTYRALLEYERRTGHRYEVIVCHDGEDVIHPLSLLLYNYLMPRKEMIQLPVFPTRAPLRQFTYWTYADEFAEHHTKELLAREMMGGFVPSAGVGTAYSRRAFELMAMQDAGEVFSTRSLTEDYEFSLRLRVGGLRTAFVIQRMPLAVSARSGSRRRTSWTWVATQAMFPRDLVRALRQKTRWILGIALQSWEQGGWPGSAFVRYNLIHDRKVLVTNPLSFLGYGLFLFSVVYEGMRHFHSPSLAPLIRPHSLLWFMLSGAMVLMAWRLIQRFLAVRRVYGLWPAVTTFPRAVWANFINFAATVRALRFFFLERGRRKGIAWDKTDHEFPAVVGNDFIFDGLRGRNDYPGWGIPLHLIAIEDEALVKTLESELASGDESTRLAAVRRVPREFGSQLLRPLLEHLRDDSWRVRAEVCRTLGFLRLPEAAAGLELAATDSVWPVRANAVQALSKLGWSGEDALLNLLRGADRFARDAAMGVLEQRGFIARNLQRLNGQNSGEVRRAREFFQTLERHGPSRLARRARLALMRPARGFSRSSSTGPGAPRVRIESEDVPQPAEAERTDHSR